MNLQDVIQKIKEAKIKGDMWHEHSEPNQSLFSEHLGEFEAILSENADEKYLVPETAGLLQFLYRGQNDECIPCLPSIYRGSPTEAEIFVNRMRLTVFRRMLHSHPVIMHFFNRHHFVVDEEGLAQHYGLKTSVLDLTSNLDVALFFAMCKYDRQTDQYCYYEGNVEHEAILYIFDPLRDNEAVPLPQKYMGGNIRPIGLQAFPRPGEQDAYSLHIPKGGSIKCWMYKFTFTSEEAKYYYDKFNNGEALWSHDDLIAITKSIAEQQEFSYNVFDETYEHFRPKGYSKTRLKKDIVELMPDVVIRRNIPDVTFTPEQQRSIIEEWNSHLGEEMCKKIVRKPWFLYEDVDEANNKIIGVHGHSKYRTFDHLNDIMWLKFVAFFEGPEGAEWKNYIETSTPIMKRLPNNGEWKKIEGSFNSIFGKPWLKEDDWKIELP